MALQLSVTARNAMLDSIETTVGNAPTLEVRTGSAPASCGDTDTGTVLATMTLPSDWLANASAGQKSLAGTWQDLSADNSGDPGHYRIKAGATCHMQGTAGGPASGADMVFDADTFTSGQSVTITSFVLTAGGA
jgi:hypothetical protein